MSSDVAVKDKNQPQPRENGLGFINYDRAAELTGFSALTLRKMVSREEVPFHRIHNRVWFDPAELRAWFQAGRGGPKIKAE